MPASLIQLLILVITANSIPVLLTRILGDRFSHPIDGGRHLCDGRPVFGNSKTWRGLFGAIVACAIVAPLMDHSVTIGVLAGGLAMGGDLLSSFIKRRLGLASSAQALLLDQVPEAIIPAVALKAVFMLSWWDIAVLTMTFTLLAMVASVIFYKLGIRKKPY